MNDLLWEIPVQKGRKQHFNPRPNVPVTGWERPKCFPRLRNSSVVSMDWESYDPNLTNSGPGWGRGDGHPVGVAIATDDFHGYYPFAHEDSEGGNFPKDEVIGWLREEAPHIAWVAGWNLGYDWGWCLSEGIYFSRDCEIYDGWAAEKLIHHRQEATLEASAQRRVGEGKKSNLLLRWLQSYFGRGPVPADDEDLDDTIKKFIYKSPPSLAGPYAESDVLLPLRIAEVQEKILNEMGLWNVFRLECQLIPLWTQIRFEGVKVDVKAAELADVEIGKEIFEIQKEVDHLAGCHLNIGQKQRIGEILTQRGIKVPLTAKTKKYSITGDFLKRLTDPLADKLNELADLEKFRGSFIKGAVLESHSKGRIHCNLKPFGTRTGRLACDSPNLQQIPSKIERLMRIIRAVFGPDEGHLCIEDGDYSQLQCRILAHFATGRGADALRAEYNARPETNYHKLTHRMILDLTGVDLPHKRVKGCNFSLIFGSGQAKTASLIGLPKEETEAFFEAYHQGLPYVRDTMESISRETNMRGYSRTILGRRVEFDLFENRYARGDSEYASLPLSEAVERWGSNVQRSFLYKATNYVIQGSEGDLLKTALLKCWKDGVFDVLGVPKLLVHDSVVTSVRDDREETRQGFREMKHILETALPFKVPILFSRARGANWGNLKEMED